MRLKPTWMVLNAFLRLMPRLASIINSSSVTSIPIAEFISSVKSDTSNAWTGKLSASRNASNMHAQRLWTAQDLEAACSLSYIQALPWRWDKPKREGRRPQVMFSGNNVWGSSHGSIRYWSGTATSQQTIQRLAKYLDISFDRSR